MPLPGIFNDMMADLMILSISWAVKGGAVLAVALLTLPLLKGAEAATRHAVLFGALTMLLLVPVVSSVLPTWQLSDATESPAVTLPTPAPEQQSQQITVEIGPNHAPRVEIVSGTIYEIIDEFVSSVSAALLFFSIWCLGCILFFLKFAAGLMKIKKMLASSRKVLDGAKSSLLDELKNRIVIDKKIHLLENDAVCVPVTFGLIRPVIVLPKEHGRWTQERMRLVLLHELAHIKRRDWAKQIVAQIAGIFHWFNPLYWLAYRKFRLEREHAADDFVLQTGAKSSTYATHLLEIARALNNGPKPLVAAVAMAKKSQLEGRLLAILDTRQKRTWFRRAVNSGLITACIFGSATVAAFSPFPGQSEKKISKNMLAALKGERGPEARVGVVYGSSIARKLPYDFTRKNEDFLRKTLDDADWEMRTAAAYALGVRLWSPPADLVKKALEDERWEVRHFGAWAAERANDRSLIEPLKQALRDPRWEISHLAVTAIARTSKRAAVEPLIEALQYPNWHTSHQAAWELGLIGDQRAVEPLIAALARDDWMTRHVAAWALGEMGAAESVPSLIAALADKKWEVRKEAAKALGRIGGSEVRESLTNLLDDNEEKVRAAAKLALEEI